MRIIDVSLITYNEFETRHFSTRPFGEMLAPIFLQLLSELKEKVIVLDFKNVEIIDFSCPHEVFSLSLIPRLKNFGDKYVFLKNLKVDHRENISIALKEEKLAMIELLENDYAIVGHLPEYLYELIQKINTRREVTAREIANKDGLKISTVSSKLLTLWKMGLVQRKEIISEEGKQFYYKSILELV